MEYNQKRKQTSMDLRTLRIEERGIL